MCGLYKHEATTEWLTSQVAVIDAWIEDLSDNPSNNMRLLKCVTDHKEWLMRALKEIGARA